MSDRVSVLFLGMIKAPPGSPDQIRDAPEEFRKIIMKQMQEAKEIGIDVEVKRFTETEIESTLDWLKENLPTKKWDGFCIGFGIRSLPEMTYFFENSMNLARELAPQAKYVFNTRVDDFLDALKRNF